MSSCFWDYNTRASINQIIDRQIWQFNYIIWNSIVFNEQKLAHNEWKLYIILFKSLLVIEFVFQSYQLYVIVIHKSVFVCNHNCIYVSQSVLFCLDWVKKYKFRNLNRRARNCDFNKRSNNKTRKLSSDYFYFKFWNTFYEISLYDQVTRRECFQDAIVRIKKVDRHNVIIWVLVEISFWLFVRWLSFKHIWDNFNFAKITIVCIVSLFFFISREATLSSQSRISQSK